MVVHAHGARGHAGIPLGHAEGARRRSGTSAKCATCSACTRSGCRTSAVSCCPTTGRTGSIRCARTRWTTASARSRPPTPRPTPSSTTAQHGNHASSRSGRCTSPPTSPGHFRLFVDGEDIIDADYRMFYVHRGMEKLAETRMGYNEVTFLADRICGICGYAHSASPTPARSRTRSASRCPLRAQAIRVHPAGNRAAAQPSAEPRPGLPFHRFRLRLHAVLPRAREGHDARRTADRRAQDLRDEPDRRRAPRHPRRTAPDHTQDCSTNCGARSSAWSTCCFRQPNFGGRVTGIGRLDPKIARDYQPVGPVVRGSGFRRDTRVDHPFAGYG